MIPNESPFRAETVNIPFMRDETLESSTFSTFFRASKQQNARKMHFNFGCVSCKAIKSSSGSTHTQHTTVVLALNFLLSGSTAAQSHAAVVDDRIIKQTMPNESVKGHYRNHKVGQEFETNKSHRTHTPSGL